MAESKIIPLRRKEITRTVDCRIKCPECGRLQWFVVLGKKDEKDHFTPIENIVCAKCGHLIEVIQ